MKYIKQFKEFLNEGNNKNLKDLSTQQIQLNGNINFLISKLIDADQTVAYLADEALSEITEDLKDIHKKTNYYLKEIRNSKK